MGVMVGLDPSGAWMVRAVQREAELQTEVLIETDWDLRAPTQLESVRRNLEETLAKRLSQLPLGPWDHERLTVALGSNERLADAYEQIVASAGWRLTEPVLRRFETRSATYAAAEMTRGLPR
jgi:hypothetical protein